MKSEQTTNTLSDCSLSKTLLSYCYYTNRSFIPQLKRCHFINMVRVTAS